MIYTLNDLPFDYNIFRTSLRTRVTPSFLEDLHVLMKVEEFAIRAEMKPLDSLSLATAIFCLIMIF